MKIIAHRGMWVKREEGNSLLAFEKAFDNGYGIETDVRDYNGQLVVSHNIANESSYRFSEILRCYHEKKCQSPIAINIKADGLQGLIGEVIREYKIDNYFVFDMSVPEQVVYNNKRLNTFTRMSEYETIPVLLDKASGIWMDEWEQSWINTEMICKYRKLNKKVAIISPEIHGRDNAVLWQELKQLKNDDCIMLCTDTPMKAKEYFNE